MDKRIAVVTGASRGIGKAIANALLEAGYFVVGSATSENGVSTIKESLGEQGTAFVLNLSDADSCEQFMGQVLELGPVGVLVNNAGITRDGLLLRLSDDDWNDVLQANLSGIFRLTKACLKGMVKARWGRIVSVGSVVGRMGNPGQANYAAAKAGVEGFSRSLAHEVGRRGITVNVVAPGYIATDMTDELSDDVKEMSQARIPLGRFGEVNEVASVVRFLVSEEAGYITAATIPVNGGLFAG